MRERARARRGALSSPALRAQHGHFAVDAALYVFAGACTAAALLLRAGSARARAASESQVVTLGTGIALARPTFMATAPPQASQVTATMDHTSC